MLLLRSLICFTLAWITNSCCGYFQSDNWFFFPWSNAEPATVAAAAEYISQRQHPMQHQKHTVNWKWNKREKDCVKKGIGKGSLTICFNSYKNSYNWFFLFLCRINFLQELLASARVRVFVHMYYFWYFLYCYIYWKVFRCAQKQKQSNNNQATTKKSVSNSNNNNASR